MQPWELWAVFIGVFFLAIWLDNRNRRRRHAVTTDELDRTTWGFLIFCLILTGVGLYIRFG